MSRPRHLTAAYKLGPSTEHDTCCSCGSDILPRASACIDLATNRVQCGTCFRAGIEMDDALQAALVMGRAMQEALSRDMQAILNRLGRCADCGDPIACRPLFAIVPKGATFKCVKCSASARGQLPE